MRSCHSKDMALSRAEFERSLKVLWAGKTYRTDGERYVLKEAGRQAAISLKELPARQLSGLLKLSRFQVTIELTGYDAAQEAAFLAAFDQTFQRGGG